MARKLRVEYPGAPYHVMSRGDRREPIFDDDPDRELFVATLGEACQKAVWELDAFCLMPNHCYCRQWCTMRTIGCRSHAVVGWLITILAAGAADDWPQWLGPNRDGISPVQEPAQLLPVPRLLWSGSVGLGCSSFAVANGRAYTMGHLKTTPKRGTDTVYCLDAETGALGWKHSYDCATCISQDVLVDGPRSTPTVDSGRVYTLSTEGHLFCIDASAGGVLWSRELTKDLPGRIPVYGYCCSPLIYRDLLLLELNAPNASYVALDKLNGNVVWQSPGGDVTCGSPKLTRVDSVDWAVFSGGGSVVALEAATGRPLWRHRTWGYAWMGPVVYSNLVFMANASLPRGCGLIRVDKLKPTVVWEDQRKFQTLHNNAVIWQGYIYGVDDTGTDYQGTDSKKSSLKCIDLQTGQVKWVKEKTGWGNVIIFDSKLLLLRETGELVAAKAQPERYEEITRAQLIPGATWSAPALANGKLYCRNKAGSAVCVRLTAAPGDVLAAHDAPNKQTGLTVTAVSKAEPTPSVAQPVPRPAPESAIANRQSPVLIQWPRFRGPGGLGITSHTNIPTAWSAKTGDGIVWKVAVPLPGPSSPVVWGQRLFLTGAGKQRREVYCYDTASGELVWQREVKNAPGSTPGFTNDESNAILAAPTPVADGRLLHVMFGTGDVAGFDLEGNPIWSRNLGQPDNAYGHAASLERWRDSLLIQVDQGEIQAGKSKLLALDAESGQTIWETKRTVPASWSSPLVAQLGGRDQVITCGGPWVMAYDPATGAELWRVECLGGEVVPSPITAAGLVLAGAVDGKFAAIRADGQGNVTRTHLVWSVEDDVPAICSPVSNGELIFLVNSGGLVVCYEVKDGQRVWEKDLGSHFQASPVLAGDRVYLLSDSGEMFVFRAGRQFELVGRGEVGEPCEASPAFQPGRLFIRAKTHLFCIGRPPA